MITAPDLERLEEVVEDAIARGDESGLHILGYGEISSVVAWPEATGPHACKRLPVFDDDARFTAYRSCFDDYVAALTATGIRVVESRLQALPTTTSDVVAYCVQPVLDRATLAPEILDTADRDAGRALLDRVVTHIERTVGPALGLDAQLSNWATDPDGRGLVYLDVTTPLLRDADGRDRLDTELFMASLPAVFRPVVRRFMLEDILDPYFAPRPAALDVAANLHKEGLARWVPDLVELANRRLHIDLEIDEVQRYYRRDARLWSLLQRARRVDRAWQRHVRRRPYPFLLPGPVDRHP
ncbi:MAG TPA: DUF6206 family protein [Acidimicrobiia bacterium]